jgi:hypothetical protein
MPNLQFIMCEDGSYLHIRNITRMWVAEDTITRRGEIKASMIGPAMPFTVAEYDTKDRAAQALLALVTEIEGEDE